MYVNNIYEGLHRLGNTFTYSRIKYIHIVHTHTSIWQIGKQLRIQKI